MIIPSSQTRKSNSLNYGCRKLSKEENEKHHKVERAVRSNIFQGVKIRTYISHFYYLVNYRWHLLECLVYRSEPEQIRSRNEKQAVENRQPKHGSTTKFNEQSQTSSDV